MIIIEKAKIHLNQKLPFALYRHPNQNILKGIFQLTDEVFQFNEQAGFVFQSFNHDVSCCLPNSESISSEEILLNNIEDGFQVEAFTENENEKVYFENMVFSAIEAIKNKDFEKVVLSRKIKIDNLKNKDIFEVFLKALDLYKSAFVYVFFHPKIGFWLGATPELLLSLNGNKYETVALAGTKLQSENKAWTSKEINEQAIVTNYIVDTLKNFTKNVNISSVETVTAGHLEHLITKISGELSNDISILNVLKSLHPTPAVCGIPKEKSLDFIKKNENYNRSFYTGFIGEYTEQQADFYVNLRCMQIFENRLEIYVGCGITSESNPEKEYLETVNKANVMKRIL